MKKKQIQLVTYGALACTKGHTPWDDIWVRYKKGRKTVRLGPCIESLPSAEYHLSREFTETPDNPRPTEDWKFWLQHENEEYRCPHIVVNTETVTRKVAEEAVAWYLKEHQGIIAPAKFKWRGAFLFQSV